MFDKSELELLYTALNAFYLELDADYQRDKAKGRHNTGWQKSVMQKILNLQSKIFEMELTM